MIIGDGDVASVLPDRNDLLFFASGVSNSQCVDESEYEREIALLGEQNKGFHIVYFSSLAVFYGNSRYVDHKWQMETLVKEWFPHYTIIRLGNITWGTNPHTIVNFLKNKIKSGEDFQIHKVYRYLIDKDEFLHWIDLIPDWNCEMNCPGRRMLVKDIVKEIKEGKL